MKTLRVTLLLICCQSCLGTLVVDLDQSLNENKNTYLALNKGIEINNPLTFCLRFNIKGVLATNYIFSSTDKLVLILRFSISLGFVLINSATLYFEIPKDNEVKPFHWHHICVSSSDDSYIIVLDGQQWGPQYWYHANHSLASFEKTILKRLDLGVITNENWILSDGINLTGLLSELNFWSKSLSFIQMVNITTNCGKEDPTPDLLNWSELPSSTIRGIKYNENIGNICLQRNSASHIYKIAPYNHDQDNAMHVCKILNGKLAFPNPLKDLQTWNGKLLRIKCINVNNILAHHLL